MSDQKGKKMPRVGRVYRATQSFETSVAGKPLFVQAGTIVKEGDPLLRTGAFELLSDVFDDEPVERATAVPGEKRAVGRPRKKKPDDDGE